MEIAAILFLLGCTATAVYTLYGVVWRLYLSPVAKFPGPRLAALTFWYEFYYDVIKEGAYVYEIERMHQKYGPIVRINPYELSINDTDLDFINKVYPSVGKEVDKFWWSAGLFGSTEMTFGTVQHHLHKLRRSAFAKCFSPAYIRRLEPTLKGLATLLVDKVEEEINAGHTVNLVHAFSALTQDFITEYCFSRSRNVLEKENFAPHWYDHMQLHCSLSPVIKQFPWLLPMLNQLPDWWVKATNEPVWMIRVQQKEYLQQVQGVVHGGDEDKSSHVTIFHEILNDPNLPNSEKTDKRMIAEAESLVGAGTLTSAHMLALTSYFVLANPGVRDKLVEELEMVMPDPDSQPSQQIFEGLPYLNAVMDEGFRLSYGSMHRLSRSHAKDALQYGDYVIPPGTPVGYSPYLIHTNPSIFPDPHSFKPERWLGIPSDERQKLRSYLSNFGRGSRQCVGMRLAYSEIYLTMGYLFRRLGKRISLKDTDYERDVRFEMDYFIPAPKVGSRGVRVAHA